MTRVFLLLGFALLQVSPAVPGYPTRPAEEPRQRFEADADTLPPTAGSRSPVRLEAIEGVPAKAEEREAFVAGFQDGFLERELPSERVARKSGAVKRGPALRNRLRLAEAEDEEGVWSARLRLEWFTPRDSLADTLARAWPGLGARVAISVTPPPEPGASPVARPPESASTEWLRFPACHPVDAAYYRLAGRQVALLVLEALHRARGELGDDQRLALEDARRIAPPPAR